MAPSRPTTCKPHKHPLLINHFLSTTVPLVEFFLCERSLEPLASHPPPQTHFSGFSLSWRLVWASSEGELWSSDVVQVKMRDVEAEAPILWPPDANSRLIGKDPDVGKDWGQKEKRMIEDEMVGWHHLFNGHESKQSLGDGKGQGHLACCSPWGFKELDRI